MAEYLLDDFFSDLKIAAARKSIKNNIKDQLKGAAKLIDVHKKAAKAEKIIEDVENDTLIEVNTSVTHVDEDKRDLARHLYRLKEEIDGVFKRLCKKNVVDSIAQAVADGEEDHAVGIDPLNGLFPYFHLPCTSPQTTWPEGIHQKRARDSENNGSDESESKRRRGVWMAKYTSETPQGVTVGGQSPEIGPVQGVMAVDHDHSSDVASGILEEEIERVKRVFAQQILWIYQNDPDAKENMCGPTEWDVHHWGRALTLLKDGKKVAFSEYVMKEMQYETAIQEQMLEMVMRWAPGFYQEYFVEYDRIVRSVEKYLKHLIFLRREKVLLLRSEAELQEDGENKEVNGEEETEEEKEVVQEPEVQVVTLPDSSPPLPPDYEPYSPGSPPPPPPPMYAAEA